MKTKVLITALLISLISVFAKAQEPSLAVLNIDVKDVPWDEETMGNLVRLEIEKTGVYKVLDKYDLEYIIRNEEFDISNCFGRICLVEAGKLLNADKMLTGSIERFDNKLIVILRLIDVKSGTIEKSNIMEYLDLPEIQQMIQVSINNIIGVENDPHIVNMLSNYDDPINTPKTRLSLNGPRMGLSYIGGTNGQIVQASEDVGGYDAFPVTSLIGYQFEKSYLSAGDFQALFEFIVMVGGLDQSRFVPSFTIMNGIRSNNSGLEIAFGPVFEVTQQARGFTVEERWYTEEEGVTAFGQEFVDNQIMINRLDSRGDYRLTTSWVWAVGKTFRSGYLNIPVNIYTSVKKNGWVVGTSFGFNVNRK
jgi:hypothetical protein